MTGKRTNGRIQVIFALDSAAPLFSLGAPNDRVAENDAVVSRNFKKFEMAVANRKILFISFQYTEGIHTNIGQSGFSEPITHAAFYPNWGGS